MSDILSQLHCFYPRWSRHLTHNLIPLLKQPPSTETNDYILKNLLSYYDTLSNYANKDTIFHFLFPTWRSNSLETPILFLGDIHPYLFFTLTQSFGDLPAWKDQSLGLKICLGEIRYWINVAVLRLLREMREAQERFVKGFSDNWVSSFHSQHGRGRSVTVVETVAAVTVDEEFVRIFREANQLRKDTIERIVKISDAKQGALFLGGVCEVLAGFRSSHQVGHVPAHQNYLPAYQQMMQQQYAPLPAQLPPPNKTVPPMNQHQQHAAEPVHVIYVGNLAHEVTRDMLLQRFSSCYPSVRRAKIHHCKEFGFVSFADENEKRRAMQEMNGAKLMNRSMHIHPADRNTI